jgi:hypothetical protein
MTRQSYVSRVSVVLLLVSGLLSGCAATTEQGPSVVQRIEGTKPAPPGPTGFLGSDYALLKPGKEGQVALVYINPDARWSGYTKVLLEPVQLWAAPGTSLPASDQHALTAYFYNALKEDLGKNFTLVDEPGPGVILVQVALNEVTGAVPILRSVSVVIPQARVLNFAQSLATGSYAFVGSAEAQAKISDSVTGQLLAAGADRRLGGMQIASAAQWRWGDAEKIMKYWSEKISGRLQELRTRGTLSYIPVPK